MPEKTHMISEEELRARKALIQEAPTGKRIHKAAQELYPEDGGVSRRANFVAGQVISTLACSGERVDLDIGADLIEAAGVQVTPAPLDPTTSELFFFKRPTRAVATFTIPQIVSRPKKMRIGDEAEPTVHLKAGVYPGAAFRTNEIGGTGAAFEQRSSGVQLKQRVRDGLRTPGLEQALLGARLGSVSPQEIQELIAKIRTIQCQADLNRLQSANQAWQELMQELADDPDAAAINTYLSNTTQDSRIRHQSANILGSRPGVPTSALTGATQAFYVNNGGPKSRIFVEFNGHRVGTIRTGQTVLEQFAFDPDAKAREGITFKSNDDAMTVHPFTIADLDKRHQLRVIKDMGALGAQRLLRVGTAYAALLHLKKDGNQPNLTERIKTAFSWLMAA